MLRIGLLGCGRIGQVHAKSLMRLETAQLVAVADAFPEAAKSVADSCGAIVMNVDDIISSDKIDAVIICTPTDTHFNIICDSANAGKAIFCEKPIDMSSERIRDCMEVVQSNNVAFLTAFNRRFDPNFANIQSRIQAGEIGNVEIVTILSRDPNPPPISYIKTSGGIFRDMMIHDFDMARFLLGEEPFQVFAVGSALVDPEIGIAGDVDTACVTLTTASGKICQISNSRRASYGYDQRVEVHGSKGMLRAENMLENSVEVATEIGFQRAPAQHFFLERYETAYLSEITHFVESINGGCSPSPSIIDGLKAQLLADAAAKSLTTGQPVSIL
ncbi:MAG: inositol 2-dehydrogenase [Amylibacter sp.]|nr:inositol 2-dehydrogenase [Amylibacter sp.]|tara:strand:+ start:7898 stop:8887 length:990 start_codon:yes stop_codon:yes gene_type:complete